MVSRQSPLQMRQFPERPSHLPAAASARSDEDEDDYDDEDEAGVYAPVDRIRRSYHLASRSSSSAQEKAAAQMGQSETIQVTLDESYFARERRFVVSQLANARQKLSSLQLFNPIHNETVKQQQQQEWTEKEKYTLDSLNEFNGPLGERFRFDKPDDGREVWPSKLQYFLAITSYSIGLGNVIRFPILVQRNGGLAFIIPFVVMLLLEGIPLFYLELAIGQRTRKAAISCWNLVSPFAVGIGIASAAVSFLIGLYYNTVVAWTLLYSWASLTHSLPPTATGPPVAAACAALNQATSSSTQSSSSSSSSPSFPASAATDSDRMTNLGNASAECLNTTPFEYFWYRETLNISSSVSDWVHFNWPVVLCLCLAWLISYLCLVRGLSTSKQLVYVVSTFPYVILCVFLVKALSLRGMSSGLSYFIEPDWPKLFDPYVWLQAAAQVFFSLGLGFGGLIALSSYNQMNNNCYRDAIRVCLINFVTSLLAGIVVFAILGYRATLNFERCQVDREQQIDFYMADYNLKALEYGAAFGQVATKKVNKEDRQEDIKDIDEFIAVRRNDTNRNEMDLLTETDNDKKFSLDDAIDSIRSLDRQLDLGSPSGSFDYGDSDTEFILNASNVIDRDTLDLIVSNIEGLPTCSIKRELDRSTRGPGLIFVVMAEAISQFESNANSWQIVFFLMILALGFDSQFGNLEGLLSSLTDYNFNLNTKLLNDQNSKTDGATVESGAIAGHDNPNHHHLDNSNGLAASPTEEQQQQQQQHLQALKLRQNQLIRQWATGCICGLSLLISIVMFAHGAGSYMLAVFDEYASSFSLVIIALFELLAISYIYGLKRFSAECELMTGKRPPFLVLLSWRYISPILLLLLVFATINQFTIELDYEVWQPRDNGVDAPPDESSLLVQVSWPYWAIVFGVLLIVCCVIWIPLIAALRAIKINIVPEEQQQRWFPADELREYHQLQDHEYQVSKFERIFFAFKQDDD